MKGVYLIHFDEPYRHARHYLGSAKDIDARLRHHRAGTGARLLQVLNEHDIGWEVVRVWEGEGRELEGRLKRLMSSMLCPVCNPVSWERRGNVDPKDGRLRDSYPLNERDPLTGKWRKKRPPVPVLLDTRYFASLVWRGLPT